MFSRTVIALFGVLLVGAAAAAAAAGQGVKVPRIGAKDVPVQCVRAPCPAGLPLPAVAVDCASGSCDDPQPLTPLQVALRFHQLREEPLQREELRRLVSTALWALVQRPLCSRSGTGGQTGEGIFKTLASTMAGEVTSVRRVAEDKHQAQVEVCFADESSMPAALGTCSTLVMKRENADNKWVVDDLRDPAGTGLRDALNRRHRIQC